MFVVLLTFSKNKGQAGAHMDGHRAWIKKGFADGVFVLAGSLEPDRGGAVIAHNVSAAEIESRVNEDPFVAEDVVTAEIVEISPAMAIDALEFLVD